MVYFGSQFKGVVHQVVKAWPQKCEAAHHHILSQKLREGVLAYSSLSVIRELQPGMVLLICKSCIAKPFWKTPSRTHPDVCFHGDCKSQVGDEDELTRQKALGSLATRRKKMMEKVGLVHPHVEGYLRDPAPATPSRLSELCIHRAPSIKHSNQSSCLSPAEV